MLPVSVTICKKVYLINVFNRQTDEHCKQCQAKVGVTWELKNKYQLLQILANIFHKYTILALKKMMELTPTYFFCQQQKPMPMKCSAISAEKRCLFVNWKGQQVEEWQRPNKGRKKETFIKCHLKMWFKFLKSLIEGKTKCWF